jgi:hypothetical protein
VQHHNFTEVHALQRFICRQSFLNQRTASGAKACEQLGVCINCLWDVFWSVFVIQHPDMISGIVEKESFNDSSPVIMSAKFIAFCSKKIRSISAAFVTLSA